jgi:hypothetical protein
MLCNNRVIWLTNDKAANDMVGAKQLLEQLLAPECKPKPRLRASTLLDRAGPKGSNHNQDTVKDRADAKSVKVGAVSAISTKNPGLPLANYGINEKQAGPTAHLEVPNEPCRPLGSLDNSQC